MPQDDIVVHCPGDAHKEPAVQAGVSHSATPKILFVFQRGSTGTVKVQCRENRCRHEQGPEYNGWFEVVMHANGAYDITPLKRQHFELVRGSGVVMAGRR